jgi:hypothetical protein
MEPAYHIVDSEKDQSNVRVQPGHDRRKLVLIPRGAAHSRWPRLCFCSFDCRIAFVASVISDASARGSLRADEVEIASQTVVFLKHLHELRSPAGLHGGELVAHSQVVVRKPTMAVVESPKDITFTCAKTTEKRREQKAIRVVATAMLVKYCLQRRESIDVWVSWQSRVSMSTDLYISTLYCAKYSIPP